ncbi:endonuclease/exonuclease/phosphatase family protein [Lewinella sp. 4G2]|uniref:endonuclease/exonuclease/phosphatase family protein n=1 Tax=Lewinella sp. 4G2 TaxID=1803372 RepID=UPI0018D34387|nr:endonuclease/exonuclease/phosphatase family protein [Lewinella sp. 4G2]
MTFILGVSALCWVLATDVTLIGWNTAVGILLSTATLYQAYRILPYTKLWSTQSRNAQHREHDEKHLRLMVCNVLQTNEQSDKVIALVQKHQPDMLVTLETNGWWEAQLDKAILSDYPHKVAVPLENLYGIHLYSKLELIDPEITYRITEDIPGINTSIKLGCGHEVFMYFVHPMPPSPTEAYASTGRDAELALVGKQVKEHGGTSIVAGDLNDVAWSHSTRLFQRLSGLLDPRIGRGLFATFHAEYWLARWPLDHLFHTPDLALVSLQRLPYVGSDHFPILVELSYEPQENEEEGPTADQEDHDEADETIAKAKKKEEDTVASAVEG